MTVTITTAVERYELVLSEVEQVTLLGFLAGYRGFTRDAYALDLRQLTAGACSTIGTCSTSAGSTSSALLATWKTTAGHAPPSLAACAPWSASTVRRRESSVI